MNENTTKETLYYPRKMRIGWCVAHEVTAAGVKIERYGIKCRTYAEAFDRAAKLNNENRAGKAAVNESASAGNYERKSEHPHATADSRRGRTDGSAQIHHRKEKRQ